MSEARQVTVSPPLYDPTISIATGFWAMPCETTWTVYLEAVGNALENALLFMIVPQFDDVVRGYLRPGHRREKRRGRKSLKFRRSGIPEIGETFGNWSRSQTLGQPPSYSNLGRWVWFVDRTAQQVGYYMMIASVVDNFYLDVVSAIAAAPESQCSGIARFSARRGFMPVTPSQGWIAMPLTEIIYDQGMFPGTNSVNIPAGQFKAVLCVNSSTFGSGAPVRSMGCRISVRRGTEFLRDEQVNNFIFNNQTRDFVASLTFNGPGLMNWEYYSLNGETGVNNAIITVAQIGA